MPLDYAFLPDLNLVHVRFAGHVTIAETMEGFRRFAADPALRPGVRQLVDFRQVRSYEKDPPAFMQMQARILEHHADLDPAPDAPAHMHIVFLAPAPIHQQMAALAKRSWEGLGMMSISVAGTPEEALAILDLPERAAASLFAARD
ncbi:hypothetical protein [Wenxinia saemankumensis]|uniref:Uncharacterized protein n=1 Tax=Wenxinia saemankumensis TaxID=1447782 RepID=A0A1M6GR65_9RHOB|nr:hypothetical protein [Wenxinia saemankumensis]SHJ12388.1 hypothetical protein SAMN05444417_2870 [Wenxinia saemankumensis]